MTLRVRPTTRPKRRSHLQGEERTQFLATIGFIAVVAVALLALLGAVGADFYNKHLKPVASVAGTGITVDAWAERTRLLQYRIARAESRIREAIASGELDSTTAGSQLSALAKKGGSAPTDALEQLIDQTYQGQLASQRGLSVSPAEVDVAQAREASTLERRQVLAIFVEPTAADGAAPTTADKEAALANAQRALADLQAGKAFGEVARQYSTDASKDRDGDYGTITSENATDATWVKALFALEQGGTTDVVKGADGVYRVGRVTEIQAGGEDPNFLPDLQKRLSSDAYRTNLQREVLAQKLKDAVVADAVSGDKEQARISEIYIAQDNASTDPSTEPGASPSPTLDEGQVKVRHILYSPNHDPSKAADVAQDDPAWAAAQASAQAAVDKLKAIADVAARETEFGALAKAESDDTGSGARGGQLDFTSRSGFVTEFSDAIFDGEHTAGEIIGPVKSQFGYHVIFWQQKRGPAAERIGQLEQVLATPGADFAQLAKESSEGATADEGGVVGWVTKASLEADVADAVFALQAGSITPKLQKTDGVHWYRVDERANRPLDPDQRATLLAPAKGLEDPKAFTDWYEPQKTQAETDKVITRSEELTNSPAGDGTDTSIPTTP